MADKTIISQSILTDIGDAVREKTGITGLIPNIELANKIRSISTSGSTETIAGVTVDGTTLKVDSDSYERIEVGQNGDDETGTVVIVGGYVPVELADEDSSVLVENLEPGNIKKDVAILGVTGTLETGTGDFDITQYQVIPTTSTTYTDGTNSEGTAIRTFNFTLSIVSAALTITPPTINLLGITAYIATSNVWIYDYTWETTSIPIVNNTVYNHAIKFLIETNITNLTELTAVVIYKV